MTILNKVSVSLAVTLSLFALSFSAAHADAISPDEMSVSVATSDGRHFSVPKYFLPKLEKKCGLTAISAASSSSVLGFTVSKETKITYATTEACEYFPQPPRPIRD